MLLMFSCYVIFDGCYKISLFDILCFLLASTNYMSSMVPISAFFSINCYVPIFIYVAYNKA